MHVVVVEPFRSLLDQYSFKNKWTSRMAQMAFFPILQPGWIFILHSPTVTFELYTNSIYNKMLNLFVHCTQQLSAQLKLMKHLILITNLPTFYYGNIEGVWMQSLVKLQQMNSAGLHR